jgi:hypothetical protein
MARYSASKIIVGYHTLQLTGRLCVF